MKTSMLKPGMEILVETGCVQLSNIEWSAQKISGISGISGISCISGNKMIEVSFESGLVCRFGANTEHRVVSN